MNEHLSFALWSLICSVVGFFCIKTVTCVHCQENKWFIVSFHRIQKSLVHGENDWLKFKYKNIENPDPFSLSLDFCLYWTSSIWGKNNLLHNFEENNQWSWNVASKNQLKMVHYFVIVFWFSTVHSVLCLRTYACRKQTRGPEDFFVNFRCTICVFSSLNGKKQQQTTERYRTTQFLACSQ